MAKIENGAIKFTTGDYRLIQRALEIIAKEWSSDAEDFDKEPGHELLATGARADAALASELAEQIEEIA